MTGTERTGGEMPKKVDFKLGKKTVSVFQAADDADVVIEITEIEEKTGVWKGTRQVISEYIS